MTWDLLLGWAIAAGLIAGVIWTVRLEVKWWKRHRQERQQ